MEIFMLFHFSTGLWWHFFFFFFVLIQQYFYDRDFFNNALNGAWQVSVDNIVTKEKENRRLWSRLGVSNFNYRLTILLEGERERRKKNDDGFSFEIIRGETN